MRPAAKIHSQNPKANIQSKAIHSSSFQIPAELMFFDFPMADIAMLVSDEAFEQRLKRGAPGAGGDEAAKGKANFGAVTKVWGSWVESAAAAAAAGVKVHVKAELAEPKTPLALAAFNGFFSA